MADTIPVWDYAFNSLKVAGANVVTNCVGSALAGYALARLRYRGRRVATLVFILAMLVPVEGIIIAQFTTMRELGLNNTLIGVVLPGCIGAMNVLLMRNAFLNLPYEIEEAAFVDGANTWQRFLRIALPSVKGTLAVVAIFAFMGAWDDFLWPLIVLSDPSKFTLTIGLNYLHGTFANDERLVAAGTVIAVAPLIALFACLQRYFFRGVGRAPSRADLPLSRFASQGSRMPSAVRFGVNYTPSEGWFHHWLDFDLDSVRADLDSIAALGLDHIRVFPLWPYFQPNRALIRPRAVEQLLQLVDAAGERGLDVNVDGLQGHLSSFDFLPAWTRTWHRRNLFTDPEVLDGQAVYLRTLAAALADRPHFIGMTLGNEVNQFSAGPPHPDPDRASSAQIDDWLERMLAACEEGAPGRLHLHAEYDATWYQDDMPFTPGQAARRGAVTAVHSWVFNGTAQRHGRTSVPTEHHAAYLIELSKAWADDPHRPVWLQEVGAPAP